MSTWPQWTMVGWIAFSVAIGLAAQAKQASVAGVFTIIVLQSLVGFTLYYGGFFAPLGWHP